MPRRTLPEFPFGFRAWRTWLPAVFLIRSDPPTLAPLLIWLPVAAASIAAASVVAMQAGSMQDLWLVREWLQHWRNAGNPYEAFAGQIDYPPAAFFVLWPMALPTDAMIRFLYLPIAVGAMAMAGLVLVRWLAARLDITLAWYEQAALAALIVSGGASRGALWRGQTAALAVLLGALSLYWSRRRPAAAAAALALCSFKPHVAIGFGLAILLTERRVVVAWAAVIVAAMSALFAASIGQSPAAVFRLYVDSLLSIYNGPDRVRGLLSIRWVIEDYVGSYELGTVLYAALALTTLGVICLAAFRRRDSAGQVTTAVACLVWPLLFLPNQLYHGVLAWPAVWLVMWPESGILRSRGLRLAVVAGYILFSVFDLPRALRLAVGQDADLAMTSYLLSPLRLALLFALILYALTAGRGAVRPVREAA